MDVVDNLVILVFLGLIYFASRSLFTNSVKSSNKLGFLGLPDAVLYEILKYVPRNDILPVTLTNKRLSEISKCILYQDIRITWEKPRTVRLKNWVTLGVDDDSLHYISINPVNFWKLVHVYKLESSKVHTIAIEVCFSLSFIRKITKWFPAASIIYKQDDISDHLFVRSIESKGTWNSKIEPCSLSVTNLDGIFIPDLQIRRLNLRGNPMELQSHFNYIHGLQTLSLEFVGPPEKLIFGKFDFDISKVETLQLKFDTCFVLLHRPDMVSEINEYLFEEMVLPRLKGLSIFSRDTRKSNGSYKNVLPFFGQYLALLAPGLKYVHLSIGCEIDISGFEPGLLKHQALLERVVWVGNVNNRIQIDQGVRYDLLRGVRLTSSNWHVSQGRVHCNDHSDTIEVQHYIDAMCRLGAVRGNSYFEIENFNRCKDNVSTKIVDDRLMESMSASVSTLVQKCALLRYIVVNGIHFLVVSIYDGHLQLLPIYDEYGGSKAVM